MEQQPRTEENVTPLQRRRAAVAKAERQERRDRNAEHQQEIYLLIGPPEAAALVAGFVPPSVRQQARAALDWEFTTLDVVGTTGGKATVEQRQRKKARR